MQRIYVGLTGLAVVTVLIVLASAVVAWRANDMPVSAVGASNSLGEKTKEEPLAELGAAPSTTSTEKVDAAAIARRQQEAQQNGEAR